jgi:hypothetical protein
MDTTDSTLMMWRKHWLSSSTETPRWCLEKEDSYTRDIFQGAKSIVTETRDGRAEFDEVNKS